MRAPARVWRGEPSLRPDLDALTSAIRRHQAQQPTPLEDAMKPDPENAPLTPEEEWAHRQQGGYLRKMEEELGPEGVDQAFADAHKAAGQ